MKRRLPFGAIAVALLVLVALVAGLLLLRPKTGAGEGGQGTLVGADIGGPFSLVDQDGRRVTDVNFAGRYRLLYFGYTYCPDVCPTDMQVLAQGFQAFARKHPEEAARVQPVFVTVDPERDTPEVVKAFVQAFDPRFVGLTGSRPEIDRMLKAYRVYAKAQRQPGQDAYLVDHSVAAYLMGPEGEPIEFVSPEAGPEAVASTLEKFVLG